MRILRTIEKTDSGRKVLRTFNLWPYFLQRVFIFLVFSFALSPLFSQRIINYKQLAVSLIRQGDFVQAMEKINYAIQLEPASADLFFLRGFTRFSLDDHLGAERDYSRAIELSPAFPDAYHYRAIVRSQVSDNQGAFEDFKMALELDGKNPEIYVNRARTNLSVKKYYSALVDSRKAVELKYNQETAYLIMGTAEMSLERYEGAIGSFDMAIRINPENPYCFAQRGLVYLQTGKTDSAIADFTHAIRIDSLNTYALFNRSLAYSKIPDYAAARNDLDKVIQLSPYNAYAYFNRAIVLINLNDKKGAIRNFDYVSKLNPQNLITYYYRARLKSELRDFDGALADLDKAVELCSDYGDAYYDRSQVKIRLNDKKGAKEDYQKAMELSRTNPLTPDSVKSEKENYLKSLVKLSGDFEEMNTINSKFQNQAIDIELVPMFMIDLSGTNVKKSRLYDAWGKDHYYSTIITLTNNPEQFPDSISPGESATRSGIKGSMSPVSDSLFKSATLYTLHRQYDQALKDYQSSIQIDSNAILAYFSRAYSRYALIQMLLTQKEEPVQISFDGIPSEKKESIQTSEMEHTYESVKHDLDKTLILDTDFYFGYYNRGYINCKMGNYHAALSDFSSAIERQPGFAEAYYNRGLIYILLDDRSHGCEDLSHAGELGILDAYKVMRRFCNK